MNIVLLLFCTLIDLLSFRVMAKHIEEQNEEFWMDAGLVNIQWKQGCLTTGGCANPRFRLVQTHSVTSEKVTISWPITENLVQEHARIFVSHWNKGVPEDLSLACEVAGTDPTYGFPRTCDASSAQRLFQTTSENTVVAIEGITPTKDAKRDVESGKMLIELQGKCFNATVAVKKYTVRCPWCPDPNSLALVEHQYMGNEPAAEMSQDVESRDHLLHLGVILLSTIAVISSTAFMCLLVAFLRQKRSSALSNKQRRYGAYHQQCQQVHVDRQFHSDESRYETPWEQKYRPIPYWVGNKSDLVAVPPPSVIETSSMIGGDAMSGHTSRTTIIGTMGRLHHSPNSSSNGAPGASDTHEDSGLESV